MEKHREVIIVYSNLVMKILKKYKFRYDHTEPNRMDSNYRVYVYKKTDKLESITEELFTKTRDELLNILEGFGE